MLKQQTNVNQAAFTLAKLDFDIWAHELGKKVDEAMNTALNADNRLSDKTRLKIFNKFVEVLKSDEKFRRYV